MQKKIVVMYPIFFAGNDLRLARKQCNIGNEMNATFLLGQGVRKVRLGLTSEEQIFVITFSNLNQG